MPKLTIDGQEINLVNDTEFFFRNKIANCDFLVIENKNDKDLVSKID